VIDRPIDRRRLLQGAGLAGGALILGGVPVDPALAKRARRRKLTPLARGGAFSSGVSCGVPTQRTATVWTRLEGLSANRAVYVEVAKDRDFRKVLYRKRVTASAKRDHTVETKIGGKKLKPGREYFYRFETRTTESAVGRFRTRRPPDSRQNVRIAVFSCQDWQAGYFDAHRAIADEDIDFALCLGDYIYEQNFYTGPRRDRLGANKDGDVQTLPEYRDKYRLYKSDPNLQALHAAHPYAVVWDDHEVEDNYAGDQPGDESEHKRVPFLDRRRAGYRAFYEYHPISPIVGNPAVGNDLYRRLRIGANVELFLLDERQYRGEQPCGDALLTVCNDLNTPRSFLGRRQMEWLKQGLASSRAAWKLVGNQLMIMALDLPAVPGLIKDQWDGYGAERRELMGFIRDRGIEDVSFLTGDIHTFFAGNVGVDGHGPSSYATEFVCGSVTSPGVPETVAATAGLPLPTDVTLLITNQLKIFNPHIKFDDQRSRGYAIVEASEQQLDVAFKGVDAKVKGAKPRVLRQLRVERGTPRVQLL
jgi:phosphodiesterase/alkaline phosphatase D-like protein